jgi:hypothetical protein
MNQKKNKTTKLARDQRLIDGIEKHLSGATLVLGGKTCTATALVALVQQRIDAAKTVDSARAKYLSAIEEERVKEKEAQELITHLRNLVVGMYGASIETLADFGFPSRKRVRASREARHSIAPKQKQSISGTVTLEVAPAPTEPKSSTSTLNGTSGGS